MNTNLTTKYVLTVVSAILFFLGGLDLVIDKDIIGIEALAYGLFGLAAWQVSTLP